MHLSYPYGVRVMKMALIACLWCTRTDSRRRETLRAVGSSILAEDGTVVARSHGVYGLFY